MGNSFRVLVVEDNRLDGHLISTMLAERNGRREMDFDVLITSTLNDCLVALKDREDLPNGPFDVILLDLYLPDCQGLETLSRLLELTRQVPVVVLTALDDEAIAIQSVHLGAQDYLVKWHGDSQLLKRAIRYAIERKKIQVTLERRNLELRELYKTSIEINSHNDLDALLKAIVARSAKLIGVTIGGLYLVDEESQTIRLAYTSETVDKYKGVTMKFGEGISGRVAESGQVMSVSDYSTWQGKSSIFAADDFKRVLAVPLKAGGKVTGVINLSDQQRTDPFTDEEIQMVSLFADQAAVAIERARLYEAERQQGIALVRTNRLIASLSQVAWRMESTQDPDLVVEVIGEELKKFGVKTAIGLIEEDDTIVVNYISVDEKAMNVAERFAGSGAIGYRIPLSADILKTVAERRLSQFISDPIDLIKHSLPNMDPMVIDEGLSIVGISSGIHFIVLPLVANDILSGAMGIWSADLQEEDVQAFSVFANQAAAALQNAALFKRVQAQAIVDEMTGLYNRRGFFELTEQQLRVMRRNNQCGLLLYLDMDDLKKINDTYGHQAGDQALIDVARALRFTFRSSDIVARIGGDEFAALMIDSHRENAQVLINRLQAQLRRINKLPGRKYIASVSMGLAEWTPDQPISADDLLIEADALMYQQKRTKKDPDSERA